MTDVVKALVLSLLQRWDANPQRLTGLISQAERDAILSLVENDDASPTTPDSGLSAISGQGHRDQSNGHRASRG